MSKTKNEAFGAKEEEKSKRLKAKMHKKANSKPEKAKQPKKDVMVEIREILEKSVLKHTKPIVDSETALNYQKQLLKDSIERQLGKEEVLIEDLKKIETYREQLKVAVEESKKRLRQLNTYAKMLGQIFAFVNRHGKIAVTFQKVEESGKTYIAMDKLLALNDKQIQTFFINTGKKLYVSPRERRIRELKRQEMELNSEIVETDLWLNEQAKEEARRKEKAEKAKKSK